MRKQNKWKAFLCFLLVVVSACQKQKEVELSTFQPNELSNSMNNFESVACLDVQEEQDFQAKLLAVNQIESTNTTYYEYHIVVAPRTTAVKRIRSITFMPEQQVQSYYEEHQPDSSSALAEWNDAFRQVIYPSITEIQAYTAYEYDFIFDNFRNELQENAMISKEQFDAYMQHITVEIIYNHHQKERLHLRADHITCFENREETPQHLLPLYDDQAITTGMRPFDEL